MKKSQLLKVSGASLLTLAATAVMTDEAQALAPGMEKCYGVAKSGMNDCAANGHSCAAAGRHECAAEKHSCAGMAKHDGDRSEYIKLPKGTCDKLVGGSTEAPKK